jgi:hypothetical protein
MDIHNDGHRKAFNAAFEEVGHTCVNWVPSVYADLLRFGDGTGPGLIKAYYGLMGWPMMLATSDRPAFVENVYTAKRKILKEMIAKGEIPARQGIAAFIDEAAAAQVRIAVIAGTASAAEDSAISSAMLNLGPARALKIQVLNPGGTTGPSRGDGEDGDGQLGGLEGPTPPSQILEQQVRMARKAMKSQVATDFARAMNLQKPGGMGVDPGLLAAKHRHGLATPEYLAAVVAAMGCELRRSVVVAATQSLAEAGRGAGLMTTGVPPSYSARGGYPSMDHVFDGFGAGGGLTWRKLGMLLDRRQAAQ